MKPLLENRAEVTEIHNIIKSPLSAQTENDSHGKIDLQK